MAVRKAIEAEAKEGYVRLTFRSVMLEVPIGTEMDISTWKAYEDGKVVTFCMEAVGPVQWDRLQRAGITKMKDLGELARALFDAMGSSEGE